MLNPIQVQRHGLRHVSFSWQHPRPEKATINLQVKLHHERSDKEKSWSVILRVEVKISDIEGKFPDNEIEVEFDGIFAVLPDYPEEIADQIVRMNGGAVLYGAARELIHQLSSRTPCGSFELPTIDARVFLEDSYNGSEKKEQSE